MENCQSHPELIFQLTITVAARQRRKSGDDVLNASSKEKEKKKEASPGFFDYIGRRPRSKSDASRVGKKPNIITSMKNAVQVSSSTVRVQLMIVLIQI